MTTHNAKVTRKAKPQTPATPVNFLDARSAPSSPFPIVAIREPLVVLDAGLRVISAGQFFYRYFQTTAAETSGRPLYELGERQWDIPELRDLLENLLPKNQAFEGFLVEHDFPAIGHRKILLNARRLAGKSSSQPLILLAMSEMA